MVVLLQGNNPQGGDWFVTKQRDRHWLVWGRKFTLWKPASGTWLAAVIFGCGPDYFR
jgi:hypothetical protein